MNINEYERMAVTNFRCFRSVDVETSLLIVLLLRIATVFGTATSFAQKPIGECVNQSKILPDVIDTVPLQRLFVSI